MASDRSTRLAEFVDWSRQHITGDEKGEAQIFLDRLFQAFGQPGCLDVGGRPEFRIKKGKDATGGTSFADYVWRPTVLIEMKKRGENLARHLRQALDYWFRIVPGRPRYVVLCNFDEFWVYDFDVDIDDPLDKVALAELPERYGPLAFLFPTREEPTFAVDRVRVTRTAADCLAACYNKLAVRKDIGPDRAQRFTLQMLIALFAEDIGLIEKYFVTQLLDDCTDPPKTFDLLGNLFRAMATKGRAEGGRFRSIPYFNGGIFAEPAPVELADDDVRLLRAAAAEKWQYVSPEIFGTIFQHFMGLDDEARQKRHALGVHYTSPTDIMKIVKPTIVDPWREAIEQADTLKQLHALQQQMYSYRVLDPACGSGNFLFIAYRQLKRLEVELSDKIAAFGKADPKQRRLGFVTAKQFYGMDILPFAVELAKVTLMLAHKLAIDELHIDEPALPLDNLDKNITCRDALIDGNGERTEWPTAEVIIGNPPFLGAKRLKPERGADYVNAVRKLYPEVPGMADYCVYWFRRAHDHAPECTADNPLVGRVGLVGTQNIRNNKSRVGGLDHVVQSGTIVEAVDNQPWSGEANVHVSIANWVKHATPKTKDGRISPKAAAALAISPDRRLWQKADPNLHDDGEANDPRRQTTTVTGKRGRTRKDKSYELVVADVPHINSALSNETDLVAAQPLRCNTDPQRSFNGQMLGHDAFLLDARQARDFTAADTRNQQIIFPYLNGREFLSGDGQPTRFVLDFGERDQVQAAQYARPFEYLREHVLPDRQRKAREGHTSDGRQRTHHKAFLERWWQLSFGRPELCGRLGQLSRYIACSLVSKRAVFVFVDSSIRPSNLLQVFTFEDDYSFGVLQSGPHWEWFKNTSSKLKSDYRFGEGVWNTFPWPQSPTKKRVFAVAEAGREIRRIRDEALPKSKGGLRSLYRTLELPGKSALRDAHTALDAAVLAAYGFNPKKDILAQLLDLNLQVAARSDKGEPVTAPGVPGSYGKPGDLVTEDCVRS